MRPFKLSTCASERSPPIRAHCPTRFPIISGAPRLSCLCFAPFRHSNCETQQLESMLRVFDLKPPRAGGTDRCTALRSVPDLSGPDAKLADGSPRRPGFNVVRAAVAVVDALMESGNLSYDRMDRLVDSNTWEGHDEPDLLFVSPSPQSCASQSVTSGS